MDPDPNSFRKPRGRYGTLRYGYLGKKAVKFHMKLRTACAKEKSIILNFIAFTETSVVDSDPAWIRTQSESGSDPGRQK
jgi:hypothetical protein